MYKTIVRKNLKELVYEAFHEIHNVRLQKIN